MKEVFFMKEVLLIIAAIVIVMCAAVIYVEQDNRHFRSTHECPAGYEMTWARNAGYICVITPTEVQ